MTDLHLAIERAVGGVGYSTFEDNGGSWIDTIICERTSMNSRYHVRVGVGIDSFSDITVGEVEGVISAAMREGVWNAIDDGR